MYNTSSKNSIFLLLVGLETGLLLVSTWLKR